MMSVCGGITVIWTSIFRPGISQEPAEQGGGTQVQGEGRGSNCAKADKKGQTQAELMRGQQRIRRSVSPTFQTLPMNCGREQLPRETTAHWTHVWPTLALVWESHGTPITLILSPGLRGSLLSHFAEAPLTTVWLLLLAVIVSNRRRWPHRTLPAALPWLCCWESCNSVPLPGFLRF